MSESRENEDNPLSDFWIANWEHQCELELENEPDLEGQMNTERDLAAQKLWYLFQNSATAVAQLYKERHQASVVWLPFQNAAGAVTHLYKESTDALRRCTELGMQAGYQRRTRDILAWAKKRRRNIRREELISYLAGKSLPLPSQPSASRHTHQTRNGGPRQRLCLDRPSSRHTAADSYASNSLPLPLAETGANYDPDLQTFREALSLASSPLSSSRRRGSPLHPSSDLTAFVAAEFARHGGGTKRPNTASPPHDVNMDSPTHKRSRLF